MAQSGSRAIPKDIPRWMYREFRQRQQGQAQNTAALAAIGRGETPDGSGTPLIDTSDFFFLPGRVDGQIGYGSTQANGNLTFSSTTHTDKGFIYLGHPNRRVSLDEDQGFLGIGTEAPAARLHLATTALGTSTVGATGTPFARFTFASTDKLDIVPLLNGSGVVDVALNVNSGSIQFIDSTFGSVGLRIAFSSTQSFVQAGRIDSSSVVVNRNLQLGGMNATVGASLISNFRSVTFTSTTEGAGGGGASVGTNDTLVAINLSGADYLTSLAASDFSLIVGPRPSATCAPIIAENGSTSVNGFEYRNASTGSAPAKVLGARKMAFGPGFGSLNTEGALIGYTGDVETMRLQPVASAALQWGFQSPAGVTQFAHAITTTLWGDSLGGNSNRFEFGDTADQDPGAPVVPLRAVGFTSAGGNRIDRLGITVVNGVTIENAFLGGGAAAISAPVSLLYVVNNASNGADATSLLTLRSKRSGQSGKYLDIVNSSAASLFQVVAGGATTIAPTTGTALTLTPPAGGTRVLTTAHTDTAYPGSGTGVTELDRGLWSLNPVLSNASGVGENAVVFSLAPSVSDFVCSGAGTLAMGLSEIFKIGLGAGDDGTTVAFGLRFFIQSQGASGSSFGTLIGANGGVDHRSTDVVTGASGVQGNIICSAGAALMVTGNAFSVATNIGGSGITTLRGLRVNNPSGSAAIGTFHGVSIAAITRGTTIVGVSSGITAASGRYGLDFASAMSRHVGNFAIGAATDPTAKLHINAGGSTTAGTAPIKLTSGTSMTAAEAGAIEFTTDDLFFTITTGPARKRLLMADPVGGLTSGRVPFATTNGRLTDDADMTFATDTLTVTKIAAHEVTGNLTFADAINIVLNGTTGTKIGTATTQKLGFWNAAPIVQPTTAVAAATFVANTSGIVDDSATFDGYTIGQVVKALRNAGLLA